MRPLVFPALVRATLAGTAAAAALLAGSAAVAGAQGLPPIRPLGAVIATSADSLGQVVTVRALSNGGVLVNDPMDRRLVLLDSTLAHVTIVADSTSGSANAYPGRFGGLLAYRGDSSLFVDPASMSMLVVDAGGTVARVMSVPRSQDAGFLASPASASGFDPAGRLVYRGMLRPAMPARAPNGGFVPPEFPDSAPILRVDIATRKVDTLAYVRIARPRMLMSRNDNGGMTVTSEIDPLPVVDDWTVLPDGSIAIVRGQDYHLEFVSPSGALTKAPKVPYEWQRLTDDDKAAVIDSARAAMEAARQAMLAQAKDRTAPGAGAPGTGAPGVVIFGGMGPGAARGQTSGQLAPLSFVSPSELPDYRPAIVAGATHADPDGNVWVRTSLASPAGSASGAVYDVIDSTGKLVDRVQVPSGTRIVGFGPRGSVYLLVMNGGRTRLEVARIR